MERGQAGLGSGASPPGAAPSDRLPPPPPPPPPPQGLRAPGSVSLRGRRSGRCSGSGSRSSEKPTSPASRGAGGGGGGGGGGRRHPRVIGRSNREPSARPRVQSSNRAEEELPPKTAKIGYRKTHRAKPAYFPKTVPPDRLSVPGSLSCCWGQRPCGEAERKGGAGNLKRWERRFPFFLSPFPVDFWANASSFFSNEEIEDPALFNSRFRGNAIILPEGRSGPGSWILRSVRDPRFAPCPPWSWVCHQFRIAWLRCVVWMDGRASQVQTGQSRLPGKATTSATGGVLIFVENVYFCK
ncbi:uncharacterized protein LOC131924921 [Peromyscus eremicus]|uniref:uncharacterized protein LOC131924921 n=1 Tax=Peromyscus eremicus TaxID=42410 RepID=UPI0027DC7E07|nr:uncharacterized protein LOC131924921 [Peromyscus eremicus]